MEKGLHPYVTHAWVFLMRKILSFFVDGFEELNKILYRRRAMTRRFAFPERGVFMYTAFRQFSCKEANSLISGCYGAF